MTAAPSQEYIVEILEEQPTTITEVPGGSYEYLVEISNSTVVGEPAVPEIIEVAIVPPVGAGVRQIETLPFTKQGILAVVSAGSEFPIGPGVYTIDSISVRASGAPVGADVVLDVLKNNVSIFSNPANKPRVVDGTQNGVVGSFGTVMLAEGDFIEVIIQQVGTTYAGDNLVASIRLERIA